jgi:FkbM family methyltransferase
MIRSAVTFVPWGLRKHIRSIPGAAQLQRWIVARTLDGSEFVHRVDAGPAKGVRFKIRMPEDKGIWTGAYEHAFAGRLASAMQPGWVGYDIGGWHGFFSGVMAAQGARKVVVFEPLPSNVGRLEELVALNPSLPIELRPIALGEADGEAEMLVMPETSMAKLSSSGFQKTAAAADKLTVQVRSLDSLVGSGALPAPDMMKLDVEGAEMMVLRGGAEMIRSKRPLIFAEVHSSDLLREFRSYLTGLGYRIDRIDDDEALAARRDVFQVLAQAA